MTMCCVCHRRKGSQSHFDEDLIGLLCPRCHFDLVRFLLLLIEVSVTFRALDTGLTLRLLKAMMNLGAR